MLRNFLLLVILGSILLSCNSNNLDDIEFPESGVELRFTNESDEDMKSIVLMDSIKLGSLAPGESTDFFTVQFIDTDMGSPAVVIQVRKGGRKLRNSGNEWHICGTGLGTTDRGSYNLCLSTLDFDDRILRKDALIVRECE